MIYDLTLLDAIHALREKGVQLSFYDCEASHLHHTIPYEAKSLEDVHIRIYTDSTKEDVAAQINEARRNIIHLLETWPEPETDDLTGRSDLYKYLYKYTNYSKDEIPRLSVKIE